MQTYSYAFECKSLDDTGTFSGIASPYGELDLQGDVIQPGAFTEDLRAKGSQRPLLWSHKVDQPIGLVTLRDSSTGLAVEGTLDLDVTAGREAYSRVRKGIARGLSIGYAIPAGGAKMLDGVRHLTKIALHEVSLVLFPAQPLAGITAVKSTITSIRQYERFLHEAGWSKREAGLLAKSGWPAVGTGGDTPDWGPVLEALRQTAARHARPR